MRELLPLLLLILASSAHAQDPYQWVGATSVSFTGDGNGLGFVGMTTQCRADFGPGARMCTSQEVLESDTLNFNAIPQAGCWIRPTFVPAGSASAIDMSGSADSGPGLSCQGWTNTSESGVSLRPNGGLERIACSAVSPVACCKPFPVAEPQASMMLPTGVGMLAMWSMMKGGA
ncbi:MAG: hypothetical protein R3F21_22040 [Myxococcota bacterium]